MNDVVNTPAYNTVVNAHLAEISQRASDQLGMQDTIHKQHLADVTKQYHHKLNQVKNNAEISLCMSILAVAAVVSVTINK